MISATLFIGWMIIIGSSFMLDRLKRPDHYKFFLYQFLCCLMLSVLGVAHTKVENKMLVVGMPSCI